MTTKPWVSPLSLTTLLEQVAVWVADALQAKITIRIEYALIGHHTFKTDRRPKKDQPDE